uniref:Uncharacterized protein n=1 Tax=Ovis aries TaxID=9940 RepID=A0AC11CCN1_SHEEP
CTSPACYSHITFKYWESSTYRHTTKPFEIAYGSGRIKGHLAYDTIQIGNLVSTDQPFGLSLEEYGFNGLPFDGILGLNYPNNSILGAIPIFDNLKKQGAISEPIFAFYLSNTTFPVLPSISCPLLSSPSMASTTLCQLKPTSSRILKAAALAPLKEAQKF